MRIGLLLLVFLAIIPAVGISVYNAGERRQHDAAAAQQQAATLVNVISAEQEQLITDTHHLLNFLARQPEVRAGDAAHCSRYLEGLLGQYPRYTNFGVADLDGNMYCSAVPLQEPLNIADLTHFQAALHSRDIAIGEYRIGPLSGLAVLPFASAVFDSDGNQIAVVVTALDLNWLRGFVANGDLPSGSTLTVADQNGVVLARFPDPEGWTGRSVPDRSLFQSMLAAEGSGTTETVGLDGVTKLYAFARLGSTDRSGDMYISLGIPTEVAYGPAQRALQRYIIGLGAALVLTVGIAWFGADLFIMGRVRTLVAATQKVAGGDFKSRVELKGGASEIALLGEAFNRMAQELEEREAELAERIKEQARHAEAEASRERISSILENINDAFLAVDRDWKFTYLNSRAGQMMQGLTGKPSVELIGRDMWEELDQYIGGRYDEYQQAIANNLSVHFEDYCPHLKIWLEVHAHPSTDGMAIFFRDITERKEAEEALRESDERFRLATSAGKVGVWDWDVVNNTVTWSDSLYSIHGLEPADFDGTVEAFIQLVQPDDREYVNQAIQRALYEGAPYELEVRSVNPGGDITWIFTQASVVLDDSGAPVRMIGGTVDITPLKKAELALRESEERYQLVLAGADAGIWDWDVLSKRVLYSPRWKELRGLSDDEVSSHEDEWTSRVHPDDYQRVMDAVRAHFEGRTPVFAEEYRVRHKDGHWIWILDRGIAQRDASGQVVRMAGSETDITQRKRAEEELWRSEQEVRALNLQLESRIGELEALFRVVPVGIALGIGPDCRFIKSNPAMAQLLGVSPGVNTSLSAPNDQLPGFRFYRNGQEIPPDELPMQVSAAQGISQSSVELDLIWEDGRVFNLLGYTAPLLNEDGTSRGSIGAFLDITERKQSEENIKKLNQDLQDLVSELQTVLEVSPVGIGVAEDPECRTIKVNPAFARLLGISPQENASKTAFPQLPLPFKIFKNGQEVRGEELPMQVAAAQGTYVPGEELDLVKEGEPVVNALLYAAPLLGEDGKPRGSVGVALDITERKQAEEALKEAARQKDRFLAMLSHELRNPLAPILGALQLLRLDGNDPAIQQEALTVLERQVRTLVRLIDDLLDVSRVTTGRIQLQQADVDLSDLVERVAGSMRTQMEACRHRFSLALGGGPVWVRGDPTRLEQVIINLLSNAAKYTPEEGQVWLTVLEEPGAAVVRVKDSGMGIDSDLLPHVFDLFSQGERTLDRAQGGLGIGLPLVKSLVEMHGGTVSVQSEGPGKGSEFAVRLPAIPSPVSQFKPSADGSHKPSTRSLKVLLVDDIEDARKVFVRLLALLGHQVRIAHDGPSALKAALEFQPDVALLDIGLPGMDGYEVAKRMRQEPILQNAILVAVTGYGQDSDRKRSKEAGFNHHLVKPVNLEDLERILHIDKVKSTSQG